MNSLQRSAVLTALIDSLSTKCRTTESHLQLAVYRLQEIYKVPIGYFFQIYKDIPHSFVLAEELYELAGERFLQLEIHEPPYSPSLRVTESAILLQSRYSAILDEYRGQINSVATDFGMSSLEVIKNQILATLAESCKNKNIRNEDTVNEQCG